MTRNNRQTPENLQASITLINATLERIATDLKECAEDIAKHGLLVQTTVYDSHRKAQHVRRTNPYLRAQRELMRSQKSLTAYLRSLEEQLQAATATEHKEHDEWADFT